MLDPNYRNELRRAQSRRRIRVVLAVALAAGSIFASTASTAHGAAAVHKRTLPTRYHKWVKRAHPHWSSGGQIILRPAVG